MNEKAYLSGIGAVLLAVMVAGGPAASGAEPAWSVEKLPGCDNLSARMAGYYEAVKVKVTAAAPQYKLPVDLAKLSNPDFGKKLYPHGAEDLATKVDVLIKRNGFGAFAQRGQEDVAAFYKNLKMRGLPIFITSDSLLHLYHIQFDETLKDIEEREFFNDALLISKAIQAEALELYGSTDGDLKKAARLLVGYSTVPVVVLSQSDLGAEAAEALKEVSRWGKRPTWQQRQAFTQKYAELLEVLEAEDSPKLCGPAVSIPGGSPLGVKAVLESYCKAHPAKKDPGDLVPKIVAREVRAELDLIAGHKGFAASPLFTYKEDYSQYVPRGHYTRSKKLKQYFKALMWYGRMTFLIRGKTSEAPGLISQQEARVQTLAACVLAGLMETKLSDGRTLAQAWDRLYSVTAYYVGLADDLTPYS